MEIEKWLQRMESRLEQMGKIATTADVLEAQQKEQKVKMIKKIGHDTLVFSMSFGSHIRSSAGVSRRM